MTVGYARGNITPDFDCELAGFDARAHASEGTLDPLYVSALCVKDDHDERFCVISFDLLGVTRAFTDRLCESIFKHLALTPRQTLICATHTHSAPRCAPQSDARARYETDLIKIAVDCAREALINAARAKMEIKRARIAGVASFRDEAAAFDMPLFLIRFTGEGKQKLLCRFTCHPTVLGADNYLFSRDLPGAAERALGADYEWLFMNGACADISTRYTRAGAGAAELDRLGGIWARGMRAALEEREGWTEASPVKLRFARLDARVPGALGLDDDTRNALISALPARIASQRDPGVRHELESRLAVITRADYGARRHCDARVALYDLGTFALMTLPVEARFEQGEALKARASKILGKPVEFVGYANGYESYVPSGKPLCAESSYEDLAARFAPNAMEALAKGVDMCARRLA